VGQAAEKVINHKLRPFCTFKLIALVSREEKCVRKFYRKWKIYKKMKKERRKKQLSILSINRGCASNTDTVTDFTVHLTN